MPVRSPVPSPGQARSDRYYQKNRDQILERKREYNRQYMRDKRLSNRRACIENLGGKCADCGVDDERVLEFHHRIGEVVSFRIGDASGKALEELLKEAAKCDLLCACCHLIRHHLENQQYNNQT